MITLLALWEQGWLDYKVESFMWRQLANAYCVRFRLVEKSLENEELPPVAVFLDPTLGSPLDGFEHLEDATYIFGRAGDNNQRFIRSTDHVVRIPTPRPCDLFAVQAAAIVLDDRRRKRGNR